MGKKKKSKTASKSVSFSVELTGLILVLIGIIGLGFGPIGNFIKKFAMFLTGEYYFIVLIFLIVLGFYMLFQRKLPRFFSSRLVGIYLIILIVLTLAHFTFIKETETFKEVMNVTHENYMKRIHTIASNAKPLTSGDTSITVGGGFIGALTAGGLSSAFNIVGTYIMLAVISLFAFVLTFNITLADIIDKIKDLFNKEKVVEDDDEVEYIEVDEEDEVEIIKPKKQKPTPLSASDIVASSIIDVKNPTERHEEVQEDITFDNTPTDGSKYVLPQYSLLDIPKKKPSKEAMYLESNKQMLENVLRDFEINGNVVDTHIGPTVTEYEIKVSSGTKVNRITNLNKEIALAMAAKDVRIQAPIPGKSTIGIEIPNREVALVSFREVLEESKTRDTKNKIMMVLGKDIMGRAIVSDLAKTPHMLVAGSTGSGKSVCINSIICSILMFYRPDEVKLVLVDPKKVELSNYNGIPHLLAPVVTEPKKANITLQKIVHEMENRYNIFQEEGVKNIAGFNDKIEKYNRKNPSTPKEIMPYIVVIIDELADLMLVASKEVQDSIMRITQLARAAGIHLIVATQRPSTDIITGVIKANIPSRIAFSVANAIDSRTILDQAGADKLLGNGDMLFSPMGSNTPTRIQGCFISDNEIRKLIDHCKSQGSPKYNDEIANAESNTSSGIGNSEGGDEPMYDEIVDFAIQHGKISTSLIQRTFRFGFNRAARVIDLMESRGIVGPANGSKPREVLVKKDAVEEED